MASHAIRNVCRTAVARTGSATTNSVRQAHQVAPKDKPLMDLLPVPEGSWDEYYKKQNAKYNMHLIGGALFLAFTYGIAFSQGILFMNGFPPPLPEKKK